MSYGFVGALRNTANGNSVTWSPAAGDLVVVWAESSSGGGNPFVTSISDGQGGTWFGVLAAINSGSGQYFSNAFNIQAYYSFNCPPGITSIALTFNGGTPGNCKLSVAEYSGIATSSPLIIQTHQQQNAPGTATDAVSSGLMNVTSQPALLLGFVSNSSDTADIAVGTGFTSRLNADVGGDVRLLIQDRRLTATGNAAVTATTSSAVDNFGTIAMAFAEAGLVAPVSQGYGYACSPGVSSPC